MPFNRANLMHQPLLLHQHFDPKSMPPRHHLDVQNLGDLKPKTPHTTPILLHHALAFPLRILRCGEQHALVSGGLFVFADAAGLGKNVC